MYIWEIACRFSFMGKWPLEKYPLEVAAWEKAFGKVPNISLHAYNKTI